MPRTRHGSVRGALLVGVVMLAAYAFASADTLASPGTPGFQTTLAPASVSDGVYTADVGRLEAVAFAISRHAGRVSVRLSASGGAVNPSGWVPCRETSGSPVTVRCALPGLDARLNAITVAAR
jgi:hypothetical protein